MASSAGEQSPPTPRGNGASAMMPSASRLRLTNAKFKVYEQWMGPWKKLLHDDLRKIQDTEEAQLLVNSLHYKEIIDDDQLEDYDKFIRCGMPDLPDLDKLEKDVNNANKRSFTEYNDFRNKRIKVELEQGIKADQEKRAETLQKREKADEKYRKTIEKKMKQLETLTHFNTQQRLRNLLRNSDIPP